MPLSTYITVPFVNFLGANELAVRLPTAIASLIAVMFTYGLAFELFKSKKIAFSASFLLAISPWHISVGRYAVEVNWGIACFIAALYFFLKMRKHPRNLYPFAIFFGITFYSYYSYLVFSLVFILILIILHKKKLFSPDKRSYFLLFVFIVTIFLIPILTNKSFITRYRQTTYVNDLGMINRINSHLNACFTRYPYLICKAFYNKPVFLLIEKFRNFINYFSTTTFFLYGSEQGLSGMPQRWGFLYLFEFPLFLLGIIKLIREKKINNIIFLWLIIFALPGSAVDEIHIWRMMTVIPLPQIISSVGLIYLISSFQKKLVMIFFVSFCIFFSFFHFWLDYTSYFPFSQSNYSYYGFRDLYNYLIKAERNYNKIIIAPVSLGLDQLYISYLFYSRFDPLLFQKEINVIRQTNIEGWTFVKKIGKWYFVNNLDKLELPFPSKTLIIFDGSIKEEKFFKEKNILNYQLIKTYHFPNGNPAFKIIQID